MKTDDLIRLLAKDHAAPRPDLRTRLLLGALAGAALSVGVVLLGHGVRSDMGALLSNWRLMVKFAVALSFVASAAVLSLRLARPFTADRRAWLILLPGPLILAVACLVELIVMPPDAWLRRAVGENALTCLVSIPLLSALPLAGIMWALRDGAPASTEQTGIAAGAMAAGIGAAIYALHCPDDSPLFLALWYTIAAAVVLIAGRAGGGRLLRW
jgi:hypothetical protein